MRKPFIAGNFKMHKTIKEALDYTKSLINVVNTINDRDILICPPFTSLFEIGNILKNSSILLGAQNMHYEDNGAYTGEVSVSMLLETNCKYVILGHSERRHIFHETDQSINLKVKMAIKNNLKPILCVGELLEERESGIAQIVVKNQIEHGINGLSEQDINSLVIAYEPVWAIGTGKTANPNDAQEMQSFIRKIFSSQFSNNISDNLRIIYGGSVKPDNISGLMEMPDVDGVLVGGACLEVDSFSKIIKFK